MLTRYYSDLKLRSGQTEGPTTTVSVYTQLVLFILSRPGTTLFR